MAKFSIKKNKVFKTLLVILVLGLIYYLLNVFGSAHTQKTNYLRMEPKPGHTRPEGELKGSGLHK
jgi:hypothetical protein